MLRHLTFLFCFVSVIIAGKCGHKQKVWKVKPNSTVDPGDPLILTPYLKDNKIELAQNMSRVPFTKCLGDKGLVSYSGFLTINETYNSNLFFWYFPPVSNDPDAPVLLWLEGGPGVSSVYGLFTEVGPLVAIKNGATLREYHWALNSHLIFIDSPVGTGFSYTENDNGYCSDEKCIGEHLYIFMQQFFTLFPKLRKNDFFLVGESYAGKFVPSLAIEIHQQNLRPENDKINLKALALGNAFCDPVNQLVYGKYLYQVGLIDDNQLEVFETMQNRIIDAINQENWIVAVDLAGELTNPFSLSYFKNFTGFNNYFNILETDLDTESYNTYIELIRNNEFKRNIHVGNVTYDTASQVEERLLTDILKSVAPVIAELLNHYRVLFYSGQLDINVSYPSTVNFLRKLNFSSADEYKKAERNIWRVDKDLAGYFKKAGNLTEVLVRNAGHTVPSYQPKWTFDLITRFMQNTF